jgi:phosphoribosyl 1,2-cyclic phosphodiesterase
LQKISNKIEEENMTERMMLFAGGTCGGCVCPLYDRHASVHTSSYGVVCGDRGFVIDNGTGVRRVSDWINSAGVRSWVMLQTHFHNDHIVGLSTNRLLYEKKTRIEGIWSMDAQQMRTTWDQAFEKPHWPARPEDNGIRVPLLTNGHFKLTGVSTLDLHHPGGCTGYRIVSPRGDIVIATDHEAGSSDSADGAYARFVNGAAVLVAEMQYRQSEYEGKIGIGSDSAKKKRNHGHSTPQLIRNALRRCDTPPRKILITHHDAYRPTLDFGPFLSEAREILTDVCTDVSFLYDGEVLSL